MRKRTAMSVLGIVLGLSAMAVADIPFFWLDKPTGRSNPNDPSSPLFVPTSAVPIAPAGSHTVSPTATPSRTHSPTRTASPTLTASPTNVVGSPTFTPTNAIGTFTSTPTPMGTATFTPTITPTPAACTTAGPGSLVADFENSLCASTEYGEGIWVSVDGNGSTASPATWAAGSQVAPPGTGNSSSFAGCMSGNMVQEASPVFPYADLQLPLHASTNVNISAYSTNNGLSFRFRAAAAGVQYKLMLIQGFADPYQVRFTPSNTNWNTYNVYFPSVSTSGLKFAQPSWATPTAWSPSIQRIDVGPVASVAGAVAYDFCIDDVTFNVPAAPAPYPATKLLAAEYGIATTEWNGEISAVDVDATSTISGSHGVGSDLVGGTPLGAFCINGTIGGGGNPYAVGLLRLNAAGTAVDVGAISTNQSMKFSYKATVANKPYRIRIESSAITDYDYYHFDFTPTDTNWHEQVVYFPGTNGGTSEFDQGGWGADVDWSVVVSQIRSVDLMVYDPGAYDICIDDVDFDAPAGSGGPGPSGGWPTVFDGDAVALGTNTYMALEDPCTGCGGGVVEASGTGAHGSATYAHVTLAATGYAGAAVFTTGYDGGGDPTPYDASSSNPDGYVSVEVSVRVPASGGNCYPPAVKLVVADNLGTFQWSSKPLAFMPYIVEADGSPSAPVVMSADVWYTARIPLSEFLGDNGEAGPLNHVLTDTDLQSLHGVAVQPVNGAYSATGDFAGEIHVDDIKIVATAQTAVVGGITGVFSTFENADGSSEWATYWSANFDTLTCSTLNTSLTYPPIGQTSIADVGGNTNGSACHSGHLFGFLGTANGGYEGGGSTCTDPGGFGYLNTTVNLDPLSTEASPLARDLSDNSFVTTLPSSGATGLRFWLKRGTVPSDEAAVIKVEIPRLNAKDGQAYMALILTADIPTTHFKKFEIPFPTDGAILSVASSPGAWPPPTGNQTNAPAPGATEAHADAGEPSVATSMTVSELWWGQAWYYGPPGGARTWQRNDIFQIGVGAIQRGAWVNVYIDDVEFY